MAAILAIVSTVGCGESTEGSVASPVEVRRAEIVEAVFEERDSAARLLWTMSSDTVIEAAPDDFRCTGVRLEILAPAGAASPGLRSLGTAAQGARLVGSRGRVRRSGETMVVTLEAGYEMVLASGWTARGEMLEWNGVHLMSPGKIEITRGGAVMRGESSVIDPIRHRITLFRARGEFEGLDL